MGIRTAVVEVDGQDLAKHCTGATLKIRYGDIATLTLDMVIRSTADYEGDATVRLTPEIEKVLTELGWTPPEQTTE
jgi:hypothetical protein